MCVRKVCKSIHSKEIKVVTRCLEGNLQMDHVVREPRQPGTCNNGLREKGMSEMETDVLWLAKSAVMMSNKPTAY